MPRATSRPKSLTRSSKSHVALRGLFGMNPREEKKGVVLRTLRDHTAHINFRRTHRTVSRPCSSLSMREGRRRPASRGHRPSRIAAGDTRALTGRSRPRSSSPRASPPRRWCSAARARPRTGLLLVHLLVLLLLDEVDDAGDGGCDLRVAWTGTSRGESREGLENFERRGTLWVVRDTAGRG